jgi:hypothetical protein
MLRVVFCLAALAIAATISCPVGATTCSGLSGTFIGPHGVATIAANPTTGTFSGTLASKSLGDGTFANVTTDGKIYASGTIVLTKVSVSQAFRIVTVSSDTVEITIGSTTWLARCGSR